eukprot:TRINITY_DN8674_c0_g1_i1.p1 TRINITY_DN8674_c0_g1~~TRINITY_DN8674_c0_g1_i1.p1  ORF type:complete len:144 (-),score=34.69 TRINITY_DN8674_c0_g1_i1:60-491(-)
MANVSDPAIQDAYNNIQSDSNPQTYVILGYSNPTTLSVTAQGEGDLNEATSNFADDQCQFAYIRVTTGDEESKRAKFVLLSWIGENAKVMQKAKMSVHKASVKSVFRNISVEFQASERDELNPEKLIAHVRKAGGANYNGQSA